MYDAVAFYKHRAEGEVHNTFAYVPEDLRVKAFRQCREVLWALDATSARQTEMLIAVNCVRIFGGTLHMLTRRYRFVDDGLIIGKPETEHNIIQARANVKLWYRIEANERKDVSEASVQRYKDALARSDELMFPGLAEIIETAGNGRCETCLYRVSYGAVATYCFGGVQLCDGCRSEWCDYLESFPERASQAFPELVNAYSRAITSTGRNTSGEGYTQH
ncbi:hypothetical protein B0H11DRAFT_1906389 [Mycena galericulata]|nr:hypothetical protein B0H11DRAFT_1906389 [Mycena galericulata]